MHNATAVYDANFNNNGITINLKTIRYSSL